MKYTLVNVTINISKKTHEKIKEFVEFENLTNTYKNKECPTNNTVEDFIVGAISYSLEDINHFSSINPLMNRTVNKNVTVKNRFKEIISENEELNMKKVCDRLGIKPSNLSPIVNNKSQPRMDLFLKIWIILGCPKLQDCIYIEEDGD